MLTGGDIAGVLLAAGSGTRFGTDKLMHRLADGRALGVAAATSLIAAVPHSVAVVRAEAGPLERALRELGFCIVHAPYAGAGMGTNLAHAVRALPQVAGIVVALADMPFIQARTIGEVVAKLRAGAAIAAPYYAGRRGHPVGFSARWRPLLEDSSGDEGARAIVARAHARLARIDCDDAGAIHDIDTPADLHRDPEVPPLPARG